MLTSPDDPIACYLLFFILFLSMAYIFSFNEINLKCFQFCQLFYFLIKNEYAYNDKFDAAKWDGRSEINCTRLFLSVCLCGCKVVGKPICLFRV